jgi:hypothetical protein
MITLVDLYLGSMSLSSHILEGKIPGSLVLVKNIRIVVKSYNAIKRIVKIFPTTDLFQKYVKEKAEKRDAGTFINRNVIINLRYYGLNNNYYE